MSGERSLSSAITLGVPLLGAVSLFSVTESLGAFDKNVLENVSFLIEAWRKIARPVADFLFSTIFDYFQIEFRLWMKDYLVVGLVFTGMLIRYLLHQRKYGQVDIVTDELVTTERGGVLIDYSGRPLVWAFQERDKPGLRTVGAPILLVTMLLLWPIWSIIFLLELFNDIRTGNTLFIKKYYVFWSSVFYFLIVIMIVYFYTYHSEIMQFLRGLF